MTSPNPNLEGESYLNALIADVRNWHTCGASADEIRSRLAALFRTAPLDAVTAATFAVARLASLQPGSGAFPPVRLFVADGHMDECAIGTDLPGTLSMTCTCGGLRRERQKWRDEEGGRAREAAGNPAEAPVDGRTVPGVGSGPTRNVWDGLRALPVPEGGLPLKGIAAEIVGQGHLSAISANRPYPDLVADFVRKVTYATAQREDQLLRQEILKRGLDFPWDRHIVEVFIADSIVRLWPTDMPIPDIGTAKWERRLYQITPEAVRKAFSDALETEHERNQTP